MLANRSAILLAVAAGGLLPSGCGGGNSSSGSTTAGSAAARIAAPSAAARAHAAAYAHAVNLRAGDVPGMISRVREHRAAAPPLGAAVARCAGGVSRPDQIIGIRSPRFRNRTPALRPGQSAASTRLSTEALTSEVYVMRSEALARQDVAAAASARARACIVSIRKRAEAGGFEHHVQVSALHVPLAGAGAYGVRISGVEAGEHGSSGGTRIYADTYGFALGRAEVVLRASGVGHPVKPSTVDRLLAVLYSRAKAHQL
jgi:hypothetical protein